MAQEDRKPSLAAQAAKFGLSQLKGAWTVRLVEQDSEPRLSV